MSKLLPHLTWLLEHKAQALQYALQGESVTLSVEQALETIQAADPSNGARAAQWLFDTYINKGYLWEDIEGARESKVFDTLQSFAQHRSRLEGNLRNLSHYGSLADVWQAIKPFEQKDEQPSSRELKRRERERMLKQSIVLHRDDQVIVAVPLSKEAAQWWGKGTRWCTAATESWNHFSAYNNKAPLIVFTFPTGLPEEPGEVRKLQMWMSEEKEGSFYLYDEDDRPLNRQVVAKNWKFFHPFFEWARKISPLAVAYYPKTELTDGIITESLKANGRILSILDEQERTKERCLLAVKSSLNAFSYIPNKILDHEICLAAVENFPELLVHIPLTFLSTEVANAAILATSSSKLGLLIRSLDHAGVGLQENVIIEKANSREPTPIGKFFHALPPTLKTEKIKSAMVSQPNIEYGLRVLPTSERTTELCLLAIRANPLNLDLVPHNIMTREMVEIAILNNPQSIRYARHDMLNNDLLWKALDQVPESYRWVKALVKSRKQVEQIVERYPDNIEFVPKSFLDKDMIWLAIRNRPLSIAFCPRSMLDKEIYLYALEHDADTLRLVPTQYLDQEICRKVVEKRPDTFPFIPHEFMNKEMAFQAIVKGEVSLKYISQEFWDERNIIAAACIDPSMFPHGIAGKFEYLSPRILAIRTERERYANQDVLVKVKPEDRVLWHPNIFDNLDLSSFSTKDSKLTQQDVLGYER